MKIAKFLAVQAVLLGLCAFFAWALLGARGSWPSGLSLDTFEAVGIGIALTAMFLVAVAWPVQLSIRNALPLYMRLASGLVSGPLGVWLGLRVLSSYPIGWEWYVSRAWTLHLVYAGVGIAFAWMWHRRLRADGLPQRTASSS